MIDSRKYLLAALCLLATAIVIAPNSAVTAEPQADAAAVRATIDPATGQIDITDAGKPVLRYNYQTVEPAAGYVDGIHPNARKYARPRSNYIHPLYGLDGELLTKDWSKDHPHHRGIYWAWPEVQYQGQLADLHALQRVFARPTGKLELRHGDGFAEVEGESRWMWEDKTPIVRELTTIRVWKEGEHGRHIDLQFEFTALEDSVTLARRGTSHYGGLNIRLSPIAGMKLAHHAAPADAAPRRVWQLATGTWSGAEGPSTLSAIESTANPQYPGDYIQYPALPWFQPTFPKAGTRYPLVKGEPLTLRYRLWIRTGGAPEAAQFIEQWNQYNTPASKETP